MNKIRGSAFITWLAFFKEKFGPEGPDKIKDALEPEDRDVLFAKPVLHVSWLDYGRHIRFLLTADRVLGQGDGELVQEGARWTARKDFSGVYRLFLSVASPKFIFAKAPNIWRAFYDCGQVRTEFCMENRVNLILSNWPNIPAQHELEQLRYFEEIILMTGAKKSLCVHTKCIARGDPECVFHIEWEM